MKILVEPSTRPPVFHFSQDGGEQVRLLEVRITEVGESEPAWWLVHRDATLEDAVILNIVTEEEAEKAGMPIDRVIENDLASVVADIGVPIVQLRYGEVPEGLRQHGSLRELRPNRLYQLVALGETIGELEFYG